MFMDTFSYSRREKAKNKHDLVFSRKMG